MSGVMQMKVRITPREELQRVLREAIRAKIIDDATFSEVLDKNVYVYRREKLLEEWMQLLWPAISTTIDLEISSVKDLTNDWWITKLRDACLDCAAENHYL